MSEKSAVDKKRINLTLGNELYSVLKDRADLLGTSVQSVILFCCTEYLKQENVINCLPSFIEVLAKQKPSD